MTTWFSILEFHLDRYSMNKIHVYGTSPQSKGSQGGRICDGCGKVYLIYGSVIGHKDDLGLRSPQRQVMPYVRGLCNHL